MIDTVIFENQLGEVLMPYEQYGIVMKSHSVSPPKPKIHRFSLDGMDGALDMTEWAGEVKFEPREVQISFRDMNETLHRALIQFCLGRVMKIMFSDDPQHYFYGRCDAIDAATARRVTDADMTFTCDAYRLSRIPTTLQTTVDESAEIVLRAARMSVTPTITVSAACTLEYGGETYSVEAGTHTPGFVVTDQPQTLEITTESTATVSVTWRDGEL